MSSIKSELMTIFQTDRGGAKKLGAKVAEKVVDYLVDVAMIEDKDVVLQDLKNLKSHAEEAWQRDGETLPSLVANQITGWVKGVQAKVPSPMSCNSSTVNGMVDELQDDVDLETLFGTPEPSERMQKRYEEDKVANNLNGARMLGLSGSLELGRVLGEGEVLGTFFYGADPRLSDPAKQQKKAGIPTFTTILDNKDKANVRSGLATHFSAPRSKDTHQFV